MTSLECIDEEALLDLLENEVPVQLREQHEQHIDRCDHCRAWLVALARQSEHPPDLELEDCEDHEDRSRSTNENDDDDESGRAVAASGTRVGRYTLGHLLGAGATGVVYSAFDPELGRRVAIKLLHRERTSARERLLREARLLAQLAHPNVVSVFDVGTHDGGVFLTLEIIDGPTLARWLAEQPRTWQEIVGMFVAAGAGLVAAHALGLVHRDFKPANVLIDPSGRPRVSDFGLSRTDSLTASDTLDESWSEASQLTLSGEVVGTPAYMAPEQANAQPCDPRCDQFSFCVALWEALYGMRPFAGDTFAELRTNLSEGRMRPRPARTDVPAWLHRTLARGLQSRPEDRFAKMDDLLAKLRHGLGRKRRIVVLSGSVVALAAALGLGWAAQDLRDAAACDGSAPFGMIFDEAARGQLVAALKTSHSPAGAASWPRVVAGIDDYRSRWIAAYEQLCAASRDDHEAREFGERALGCLEDRRAALKRVVERLSGGDRELAARALDVIAGLPSLQACLESASDVWPDDRALAALVTQLRTDLADVRISIQAGLVSDALRRARSLDERAQPLGFEPLSAEVALWLGLAERDAEHPGAAAAAFERAYASAMANEVDYVAARAALQLLWLHGSKGEHELAGSWRLGAEALVRRSGDRTLLAKLEEIEGTLAHGRGEYERALEHFERAEHLIGDDDASASRVLTGRGQALFELGRWEPALDVLNEALERLESFYGAEHPEVADCRNNLATVYLRLGRSERALALLQQVHDYYRSEFGPQSEGAVRAQMNIGLVLVTTGDVLHAERSLRSALEQFSAADVLDPTLEPALHLNLGWALALADRTAEALAEIDRGRGLIESTKGHDHSHYVRSFAMEIVVLRRAGERERLLAVAERAVALAENTDIDVNLAALLKFELAQALRQMGRQPARARELATEALRTFEAGGAPLTHQAADVRAWLRK